MPAATPSGEPDAGNPHVRFDEGATRRALPHGPLYSTEKDKLLDNLHGDRKFEELLGKARDRERQFARRFGKLRLDPTLAR
jgi:hypothetical protein